MKLRDFFDKYWILIVIIFIKLFLQFIVVNPVYELHRDEFLHLDQANHLAFGFISVPPLTSLFSKLIFLCGGSLFWIRFLPAIFGALTIVFTWLIVETLGGKVFSKILASSAILFSVFLRINILFQPNSFDILAWTIIFFLLIRFVQSEKSNWLFLSSLIIAIGIYNKYNLLFLLIGLTAGFIVTRQRKIFLNPSFWKALVCIVLLCLPNLIWQIVHQFPVFQHMKVLNQNQLVNNTVIGFLKGQFIFFIGSIPLLISALISFIYFRPFKQFRFVGICFVFTIALFAFLRAKDYYAMGLYPVLFGFGSVYIEDISTKRLKTLIISLLIGINLGIFILTANYVYPIMTPSEIVQHKEVFEKMGLLKWEDGKNHLLPQDFADMIGWQEMAGKALIAYKLIPENELNNTLIFCDNYGQTGALNYYNRSKMHEAYSFNTDYIYWLPRFKKIQNIILVGNKPRKEVIDMFKNYKLVGVVVNKYAREKDTGIYLLSGANDKLTAMFYKIAEERKNKMDIF